MFSADLSQERLKPFPVEKSKMRIKRVVFFLGLVGLLVMGVFFYGVHRKSHSDEDDFWARNAATFKESWDAPRGRVVTGGSQKDSHPPIQLHVAGNKKKTENRPRDGVRLFPQGLLQTKNHDKQSKEEGETNIVKERALKNFEAEKEKQWIDSVEKQQKLIELQGEILRRLHALQHNQRQKEQQNSQEDTQTENENVHRQWLLELLARQQKQSQSEQHRPDQPPQQAVVGGQQAEDAFLSHPVESRLHPQQSQSQQEEAHLTEQSENQQKTTPSPVKSVSEPAVNQQHQRSEDNAEGEKKDPSNTMLLSNHGGPMRLALNGIQKRRKITHSPILNHARHLGRLSRQTTHSPKPGEEREHHPALQDSLDRHLSVDPWNKDKVQQRLENEMDQAIQKNDPFLEGTFEKIKEHLSADISRGFRPEVESDSQKHDNIPKQWSHSRNDAVLTGTRAKVSVYDLGQPVSGDFRCTTLRLPRFSNPICLDRSQSSKRLPRAGSWQEKQLQEFQAILDKDSSMGVLDVGAGLGMYTVAAARRKRHVVAVEPRKKHIPAFHKTIKTNSITHLVTLVTDNMWDPMHTWHHATLDDALPFMNFTTAVIRMIIPYPGNEAKVLRGAKRLFSAIVVKYVLMFWTPSVDQVKCKQVESFLRRYGMEPIRSVKAGTIYSNQELSTDKGFIVWRKREKSFPEERTHHRYARQSANAASNQARKVNASRTKK